MKNENFMNHVLPELKNMMGAGRIDPEVYAQLLHVIDNGFTQWSETTAEDLKQKAKDWEDVMGPEKEGFYSLGLRRSADLILGKSIEDSETDTL